MTRVVKSDISDAAVIVYKTNELSGNYKNCEEYIFITFEKIYNIDKLSKVIDYLKGEVPIYSGVICILNELPRTNVVEAQTLIDLGFVKTSSTKYFAMYVLYFKESDTVPSFSE